MLISHRKKFIYTKTVKTAGTSVEVFFEKWCMPQGGWKFQHARETYVGKTGIIGSRGNSVRPPWYNHMPAIDIRRQIGNKVWEDYYKFCVIRDPFDKTISAYFFLHRKKRNKDETISHFKRWLRSISIRQVIWDRDKYMIGGKIAVDYFIRFENLFEDMCKVCKKLDIPRPNRIPKLKSGRRRRDIAIGEFYDDDGARKIRDTFRFELSHFGYSDPR